MRALTCHDMDIGSGGSAADAAAPPWHSVRPMASSGPSGRVSWRRHGSGPVTRDAWPSLAHPGGRHAAWSGSCGGGAAAARSLRGPVPKHKAPVRRRAGSRWVSWWS